MKDIKYYLRCINLSSLLNVTLKIMIRENLKGMTLEHIRQKKGEHINEGYESTCLCNHL
ncbi:hypothetical protein PFDG_02640 [Plasmodium falciparum Dd2]|uniref:Uncharacterized protein n=1 Tax=Plasmodium falciparum (isolate Dd2) TaxID=57267 RepID=A0A0L7M1Y1_PLAF4|nr:hypothetical protein PFDG_02640 [Plasmodium falciparum Dd2]